MMVDASRTRQTKEFLAYPSTSMPSVPCAGAGSGPGAIVATGARSVVVDSLSGARSAVTTISLRLYVTLNPPHGLRSIGHCCFEDSVSIHLRRQCMWKMCVHSPHTGRVSTLGPGLDTPLHVQRT